MAWLFVPCPTLANVSLDSTELSLRISGGQLEKFSSWVIPTLSREPPGQLVKFTSRIVRILSQERKGQLAKFTSWIIPILSLQGSQVQLAKFTSWILQIVQQPTDQNLEILVNHSGRHCAHLLFSEGLHSHLPAF